MKTVGKFAVLVVVALAVAPQLSSARNRKDTSSLSPLLAGEEVGAKYHEMLNNFWRVVGIAMKLGVPLCPFLASEEDCENSPPITIPLKPLVNIDGKITTKFSSLALSFDKQPLDVSFASIKYYGEDKPLKWEWEYILPAIGIELWYNFEGVVLNIPLNRTGTLFVGLEGIYLYHKADLMLKDPLAFEDNFEFELSPLSVTIKPNNLLGNPQLENAIAKVLGEAVMTSIKFDLLPGFSLSLKDLLQGLLPPILSGSFTDIFREAYTVWFQRMEWDAKFMREIIGKPAQTKTAAPRTRFLY